VQDLSFKQQVLVHSCNDSWKWKLTI